MSAVTRQPVSDLVDGAWEASERAEPVKHRGAQLVQPRVRQLHLGLDTRDLRYTKTGGTLSGVTQKRRLADAGLAPDDEHCTLPAARLAEHLIQPRALAGSAPEPRLTLGSHR